MVMVDFVKKNSNNYFPLLLINAIYNERTNEQETGMHKNMKLFIKRFK